MKTIEAQIINTKVFHFLVYFKLYHEDLFIFTHGFYSNYTESKCGMLDSCPQFKTRHFALQHLTAIP